VGLCLVAVWGVELMAKSKRAIHFTAGPAEKSVGIFGWYSACGFVQRWSHTESKAWDVLTEDSGKVTCVHCKRELAR